ncbi:MAG: Gx transporter family protein [Oscillospiraceae bacterium]|nr:Gx transporter family protein [Oscillospiraceae bacterium]
MKASKLSLAALSVTLAMILSFVESQIPAFVAIPGVKIGLTNIVIIYALYKMGWKYAVVISLVRVLLVGILFGNGVSLIYSFAGAVMSFAIMVLLKNVKVFSTMAVSVAGGVTHNMAQIGIACIIMETNLISYYAPFLVLSGTLAGIAIGVISAIMIKRVDIKIK